MESESPIKAWVKRHSPLKNRNKPLPPRPIAQESSSPSKPRAPGLPISGNASPTKTNGTTVKPAKRKISSLLKHKSADEGPDSGALERHNQSQATLVLQQDRPRSSQSGKEPVEELSDRVSALEAQLRTARAELANATTSTASGTSKRNAPWRLRSGHPRRASSFDSQAAKNQEIQERQQRVLQGNMFEGVVESLLAPDYKSASKTAASYSTRATRGSRRSISGSGHEQAMADYRNLESAHMGESEDETRRLTRLRSELRAAEWMRIQEHMAKEQEQYKTGSKRSSSDSHQGPEERPARRLKHSEADLKAKALPSVPRSRRAASENDSTTLRTVDSTDTVPIMQRARPQRVNYSHTRPKTPDEPRRRRSLQIEPSKPATNFQGENVTVFAADEEDEQDRNNVLRRSAASPSRLGTVSEEYEWDEDVF